MPHTDRSIPALFQIIPENAEFAAKLKIARAVRTIRDNLDRVTLSDRTEFEVKRSLSSLESDIRKEQTVGQNGNKQLPRSKPLGQEILGPG